MNTERLWFSIDFDVANLKSEGLPALDFTGCEERPEEITLGIYVYILLHARTSKTIRGP